MSRPSVLLTRRWPEAVEQQLRARYDVTLNPADVPMQRRALAEALAQFDYICPTITDCIDSELLGGVPMRAKAFCNFGAGFNHIDLAACRGAGIVVTNTPDVLTDDTADLAITLALMCARRAGEGERLVRAGKWSGWNPTQMLGRRLSGKTLGVVGYGRIGQATAARARHGFGMKIVVAARNPLPAETLAQMSAVQLPLDDMLAVADIVSLHIPGGAATRHLINARRLTLMKPGAILVNTARGDVIDEEALVTSLRTGQVGAAGLDVYADEPAVSEALRSLDNAVLLPHLGSATVETRTAMGLRAVANLDAIVEGREPPDRVA